MAPGQTTMLSWLMYVVVIVYASGQADWQEEEVVEPARVQSGHHPPALADTTVCRALGMECR